jgi:exosortase
VPLRDDHAFATFTSLPVMTLSRSALAALALFLVSGTLLFRDVTAKLVSDWWHDDNYSHGFFIVPLALYFAWERRERLAQACARPHWLGALVVLASVAMLIAGVLGAELFLTRLALLGVLGGTVLYVLGASHLRILAFPLAFLLLMIPIPAIVFNQVAFPLQILASQVAETTLHALRIPVLREGNLIALASTTLEVAEACSGIRSLVSLLTLGIVYGYFADPRPLARAAIALATVPIAIAANALRVAGTGVAAHFVGAAAAEGFLHAFSGWLVFVAAFAMLLAWHRLLAWVSPAPRPVQVMEAV